ncbi:unnamed protein product [Clonostachys solani]|uniref:NAD(P)-binding domain-containing protein n=1 Tax=Clonostachys solani TaxID=160281 RepID=A0A9N9W9U2_9HYPO|nr:unnamed protein product [Clonostachys solani]
MTPIKVGVIGVTGMTGSHVAVELLNRGHQVVGISRNPTKLGQHERYEPREVDLKALPIEEIATALKSLDVVVNAYGPHTQLGEALSYKSFTEVTRKILLAAKVAEVPYFFMIGGSGIMKVPDSPSLTACEDERFYYAFIRGILDSEAYVKHAQEWAGEDAETLSVARQAWMAEKEGRGTAETRKIIEGAQGVFDMNGPVVEFHQGGRLTAMFFHGNTSFKWTFMSTPALYRPGKRTGSYEVCFDYMPLKPAKGHESEVVLFEGRLHGIALSDMALAVAEEVESKKHMWKHWCPYVPDLDDTPGPVYVKIGHVFV